MQSLRGKEFSRESPRSGRDSSQNNYSLEELIALLPEEERDWGIQILEEEGSGWYSTARTEQLPPRGDWFIWLLRSGRGAGKTRTGSEWTIERVRKGYRRIALVGETKADVRDIMVEVGDSSIMKVCPKDFMPNYEPSKRRLTFPNGSIAIVYSGDEPDQLRGQQHDTAWVDELAKFQYPQDTWDNLEMGMRLSEDPRVIVTTTPRPIKVIKDLLKDPRTIDTQVSTFANRSNLPQAFLRRLMDKYEGTRLGRQEIYGEILEDVPGALWKREYFKYKDPPRDKDGHFLWERCVVAIDPAVTSLEGSDETGIIGAGKGQDGEYYIVADKSGIYTPVGWANRAISLLWGLEGDMLIGEVNNGGDLIEMNLRNVDAQVPYKAVRASRGKMVRAEPISALYEQGRVNHTSGLMELEDQLCTWTPDQGDSPDRLDALVWALSELSDYGASFELW